MSLDLAGRVLRSNAVAALASPHGIDRFSDELAEDLAALPAAEGADPSRLRVLAELFVTVLVGITERLLTSEETGEAVDDVVSRAREQLRMILFGALGPDQGESSP